MGKLLLFNPDTEMAIADNSANYTPPKIIANMAYDLSILPCWWGKKEDIVKGEASLYKALPESSKALLKEHGCTSFYFGHEPNLKGAPWGMNMREYKRFKRYKASVPEWNSATRLMYSRESTIQLFTRLLHNPNVPECCQLAQENRPKIYTTVSWLQQDLILPAMLKRPWSSSGRGNLELHAAPQDKEIDWIAGSIKRQGFVVAEKFYDKIFDFALEFHIKNKKCKCIGYSIFETTGVTGAYTGNIIDTPENLKSMICQYISSEDFDKLESVMTEECERLFGERYEGYFGVDMFAYKDENGCQKIYPCVEINLRMNMGILAIVLNERYGMKGTLKITCGVPPTEGDIQLCPALPNSTYYAYVTPKR